MIITAPPYLFTLSSGQLLINQTIAKFAERVGKGQNIIMADFLPKDYTVPSSSSFMKFQPGENTFRIISPAVLGWEYWTTDNKPVHSRTKWETTPVDIKKDKDGKSQIKHFWNVAVYNYKEKEAQTLTITQVNVQNSIKSLIENKKWGDPTKYDITVIKEGTGFDTTYTVMPNPHVELPKDVAEKCKKPINLESIFGEAKDEVPFE